MTVLALGIFLAAPPANGPPRWDAYGDPLPPGAVARLGTARLRHAYKITGAVFSGDGKSIFASDYYSGVRVWDAADGRELRRFFPTESCYGIALSPDGRTLAVNSGDLSVRLCDPDTGRIFGALPVQNERGGPLVFSPDGKLLATGVLSRWSVRIWDVATLREVGEVPFPEKVGTIQFSADGKHLVAAAKNGGRIVWDIAGHKYLEPPGGGPDSKDDLDTIAAPGLRAVYGYADGSVRLFDADGPRELHRFNLEGGVPAEAPKPWGWRYSITASFSPDGKTLALFRNAGRTLLCRVELWDVATGKMLRTLPCDDSHKPTFLRFSPDGTKLLTAGGDLWSGDNAVRIWDVARGVEPLNNPGHGAGVTSVAVAPDGATVATTGGDGIVNVWERDTGRHAHRLGGHTGRQPTVLYSPDGRRLIWWGTETLQIWDTRAKQLVSRLRPGGEKPFWNIVSDDGATALSIDVGKSFRSHDLATGNVIPLGADPYYRANAFAPAHDRVVWSDGSLTTAAGRKLLADIGRVYGKNPSVRFTPDGRRLVAAVVAKGPGKEFLSDPHAEEIAVFDSVAGKELRRFGNRTHRADNKYYYIDAAAISADGRTVATAGHGLKNWDEPFITLWETETGRQRGGFVGHRGEIASIAISADGRFVVTGAGDTTAFVWDATNPPARNTTARADAAARFDDLAGDGAEQAYRSIRALIDDPAATAAFLKDRKVLFETADGQKIRAWVRDLDSSKFADRKRASEELALILDEAEPFLTEERGATKSAEVRQRIDQVLQRRGTPSGRELQRLRSLEVLEYIAAAGGPARPAAVALIEKLAARTPGTHTALEAAATLKRMEKR